MFVGFRILLKLQTKKTQTVEVLRESLSCCVSDWSKAARAFKIITLVFAAGLLSCWCCNSFKCWICFSSKRNGEAFLHLHDDALVESEGLLKLSVVDQVCLCHLGCQESLSPVPWTGFSLDMKICQFYLCFKQLLRTKGRIIWILRRSVQCQAGFTF